ncbi:MAG: hypothetical protein GF331_19710 [Chitinivibrionales bacterium]|nr:hypothetical protein [Chitinivibrionales bacterium]
MAQAAPSSIDCADRSTEAARAIHAAMTAANHGCPFPTHCVVPLSTGVALDLIVDHEQIGRFNYHHGTGHGILFGRTADDAEEFARRLCCSEENLAGRPEDFLRLGRHLSRGEIEECERTIDVAILGLCGAAWRMEQQCGTQFALRTLGTLDDLLERVKRTVIPEAA